MKFILALLLLCSSALAGTRPFDTKWQPLNGWENNTLSTFTPWSPIDKASTHAAMTTHVQYHYTGTIQNMTDQWIWVAGGAWIECDEAEQCGGAFYNYGAFHGESAGSGSSLNAWIEPGGTFIVDQVSDYSPMTTQFGPSELDPFRQRGFYFTPSLMGTGYVWGFTDGGAHPGHDWQYLHLQVEIEARVSGTVTDS